MERFSKIVVGLLVPLFLQGQTRSATTIALDSITLEAFRIQKQANRLPFAVSVRDFSTTQDQRQQLSLADYLQEFPGVFSLNAQNFAQDLRVAIRGFGARSAFGIRGIKLVVDGIPETTPDGQGQVDNLNLGLIDTIELIRGGAASLYGNASGGVISIRTLDQLESNTLRPSMHFGSFGFQNFQLQGSYQRSNTLVMGYMGHSQQSGYRKNSAYENLGFNIKVKHQLQSNSQLTFLMNYANSPEAQDPGGLTAEAVMTDRRQARQRNVDFLAGESVGQFKLGTAWQATKNQWEYQVYAFYTTRDFLGRLPFANGGIVDLGRRYGGFGGSVQYASAGKVYQNRLRLGVDGAQQTDQRRRFVNNNGAVAAATLNQEEQFSSFGFSLLNDWQWKGWTLLGGLRYDRNRLAVEDHFLSDGMDSGARVLPSWNYSLGLNYQWAMHHRVFVNTASSYETPVLSELSTNPSGKGGFNNSLQPQEAQTVELGYAWAQRQQRFSLTAFFVDSRNELVPFEQDAFPGRTFYRNAGRSSRQGLESSYLLQWRSRWQLQLNYTYSDFRYQDYQTPKADYSDMRLPGLPQHLAQGQLRYQAPKGLSLRFSAYHRGQLYANDANTATEAAVTLFHLDAALPLGFFPQGQLFFGIQNLRDVRYSDNIRLNAFGNRFYEPAPGRSVFGGVRFQL
jgi:iron complex outermembrane receptor protein